MQEASDSILSKQGEDLRECKINCRREKRGQPKVKQFSMKESIGHMIMTKYAGKKRRRPRAQKNIDATNVTFRSKADDECDTMRRNMDILSTWEENLNATEKVYVIFSKRWKQNKHRLGSDS